MPILSVSICIVKGRRIKSLNITIMIKFTSLVTGTLMLALSVLLPVAASAQISNTMPALYDASGDQVNDNNSTSLAAGYYFLDSDAEMNSRVYYFGNGTYYNANTGMYGGHISNPSGRGGATFVDSMVVVPGVPNTGAGGQSPVLWLMLALTGILAITGMTYLISTQSSSRR